MTFKATFIVEDLESALEGLRQEGMLAKQSTEVPDVVIAYSKDKDALIKGIEKFHKQRGLENIVLGDAYYKSLVVNEKADDTELLAAVKEPERKDVSIEDNKTEADLYAEVHPLDLGGVKHAENDADLLKKVKAGDDFSVELDPIDKDDDAARVTQAQTQRGGTGNPNDETRADGKPVDPAKQEKADKEGAEIVGKSIEIASGEEDAATKGATKKK